VAADEARPAGDDHSIRALVHGPKYSPPEPPRRLLGR
jgi:hypothetical protein